MMACTISFVKDLYCGNKSVVCFFTLDLFRHVTGMNSFTRIFTKSHGRKVSSMYTNQIQYKQKETAVSTLAMNKVFFHGKRMEFRCCPIFEQNSEYKKKTRTNDKTHQIIR